MPSNGAKLLALTLISGISSDPNSGILTNAKISIKNVSDNLYWPGATPWETGEYWINVNNASGDWTQWTYTAPAWTDGKNYQIRIKALDNAGNNETAGAGNTFIYDISNPTSQVTIPTNNTNIKALVLISGTAVDAWTLVTNVQLSIKIILTQNTGLVQPGPLVQKYFLMQPNI